MLLGQLGQNSARSRYTGGLQNANTLSQPQLPDYKTAASQAMSGAHSAYRGMSQNIADPSQRKTATGALGALSSGVGTGIGLHTFAVKSGAIAATAAPVAGSIAGAATGSAAGAAALNAGALGATTGVATNTGIMATLGAVPGIGWAVGGLALASYLFG